MSAGPGHGATKRHCATKAAFPEPSGGREGGVWVSVACGRAATLPHKPLGVILTLWGSEHSTAGLSKADAHLLPGH